jgi:hypothetical protein
VKFLARGNGYALFLTPTEAVLTLQKRKAPEAGPPRSSPAGVKGRLSASAGQAPLGPESPATIVRLKLVGANPHPDITGMDELPGKVNYLRGNDPKQWRTNVPRFWCKFRFLAPFRRRVRAFLLGRPNPRSALFLKFDSAEKPGRKCG